MKCFVMMPYGKTESAQKEYSRIYKLFIKSAAEECGLDCIRSDIEGKGGHIMANVLENLAYDDIAIADLSELNWNVAYELGIRHVLRKSGTILMCNNETELPFDVQSLNIFVYPKNWLDDMEDLCDKLKKVIMNRVDGVTKNDSPVHEKYSFLPEHVVKGHAEATDDSLKNAKQQIAALEHELADVYAKVESMGLSLEGGQTSKIDYTRKFLSELSNSIYNGDSAVAKLRELLDRNDKEAFLEFLGKVLSVGFLDEGNCRSIYILCRKLGIPAITRTYLEAVTGFYPENNELFGFLADEYSKNYHTGDKALQIVNSIIGVSKKDGAYVLSKTVRIARENLASFFNVYNHMSKYADLLDIGELILKRYEGNRKIVTITLRNMTNAAIRIDALDVAKKYKDLMLLADPENDMVHWVCARYEVAVEDIPAAIEETEKCIALARSDVDYYMSMAGLICDEQYARDPQTLQIHKIADTEVNEYAVPFALAALMVDPGSATRVIDFLRRNKFSSYIDPLVDAYRAGNLDMRNVFSELDFTAVDYCLRRTV